MSIIPAPSGETEASVRLLFRLLLAVDIKGYSARSPRMQLQAQADLLDAMKIAAEEAGLDRDLWHQQVSGDGELAVLPSDEDIVTVVGTFAPALERALAKTNGEAPPGRRLRVRLAFHHGALIMGPSASFGPAGDAPVVVSRLLDARPLRRYLTVHPERSVAFIISEQLYREVVCSGFCALPPGHFQQVRTTVKGVVYQGYIYDPDREVEMGKGSMETMFAERESVV
jgi:class 3 adenylate cyclase